MSALTQAMAHACNLRFPTLANAGYSKSQVSRSCKPLRRQQIRVDCAANEDGKGSVVTDDGSKQPSPLKGFKVKRVERLGEQSLAGVANIDRGDSLQLGQLALLVGGDAAALLLFAGIGRRNHSEGLQLAGLFGTALPFLIGWYVAAVVTGAYNLPSKQKQTVSRAVTTAARAWLLATPSITALSMPQVALALRSAQRGYLPDKSFVIVAFIATGVLLVGWRAALAAILQKQKGSQQGSQNKQGNLFEFFQLLASLTKRW